MIPKEIDTILMKEHILFLSKHRKVLSRYEIEKLIIEELLLGKKRWSDMWKKNAFKDVNRQGSLSAALKHLV